MRLLSLCLGLLALLACCAGLAAAAQQSAASAAFSKLPLPLREAVLLVVPQECLPKFFSLDFSDLGCIRMTVSKLLGFAIIAGACVVKLPQIIKFLRAGSTEGVSLNGAYSELLGCMLQTIYHVRSGTPFSAYGETAIITVQTVVIVLLMWYFKFPGLLHTVLVSVGVAAAAQAIYAVPVEYLSRAFLAASGLFIVSRLLQVVENVRARSTGQLAPLTLIMNFAGTAARVFTSSTEVKQLEVKLAAWATASLNGIILAQLAWYGGSKAAAAVAARAAPVAATPAGQDSKKRN